MGKLERSSTEKIISDFANLELDKADEQTLRAVYSAANNMMLETAQICREKGIEL